MESKKATHGGAGRGQGRKSILEPWQELLIVTECEAKWRFAAKPAKNKRAEKVWERVNSIPVKHRRTPTARDTLAEARDDLDAIFPNGRVNRTPRKRPKGKRDSIIHEAIKDAEFCWGITLKANYVADCWKKHRHRFIEQT